MRHAPFSCSVNSTDILGDPSCTVILDPQHLLETGSVPKYFLDVTEGNLKMGMCSIKFGILDAPMLSRCLKSDSRQESVPAVQLQ